MFRNGISAGALSLAVLLACAGWCGGAHAVPSGFVQVTLQPEAAVAAGALWSLDGVTWRDSGALEMAAVGSQAVYFKSVPGWAAPASQTVLVEFDTTTLITGTYRPYELCEGVGACNRSWVSDAEFGGNLWFVQEPVNHDGHNALQSGAVAPGQVSRVATTVEGPCTLSFWWKVSCNADRAEYYFYVDGAYVTAIRGETDWMLRTHELGPGSHPVEFLFYRAAHDTGGGWNCGWVDQFLVQESTPPTGSVAVNGGAAFTNTPKATLTLAWQDAGAGVTGVRFSNNGSTWSPWQEPLPAVPWNLTDGEGLKNVRAQFRDKAGNVSVVYTDTITVEQAPPSGTVAVNGGAVMTNALDTVLDLTWDDGAGSGVSRMRFSNNGSAWSPWEAAAATKRWALALGDGVKTVRAQFMDRAGNVSAVCADTVVLDQTPPTGGVVINGGASVSSFFDVFLELTWADGAGSGVFRMRLSDNGSTWSPWEAAAPTKGWTLPGAGYRTVRVQFVDRAGNVSPAYSDYINVVPAP